MVCEFPLSQVNLDKEEYLLQNCKVHQKTFFFHSKLERNQNIQIFYEVLTNAFNTIALFVCIFTFKKKLIFTIFHNISEFLILKKQK